MQSVSHDGVAASPPGLTARKLAVFALVLLIAGLPITRVAAQFFFPSGAATAMARAQVEVMELLFMAVAMFDRRVRLPGLSDLPRPVVWLGGAWLLWSLPAILGAQVPSVALVRQMEFLLHGLFGATVWAWLRAYPQYRPNLPRWLVMGCLAYLAGLFFFLLNVPDKAHFPWLGGMLGFVNVRHFGHYIAIALLAAYAPYLNADNKVTPRPIDLIFLTILWGTLFWSGGRGPLLAVFGSMVILTALKLIPSPKRLWSATLLTAIPGALISIPLTPPNGSFGIFRLQDVAQVASDADAYSSGRLDIWLNLLPSLKAHPWFGIGPDQYRVGIVDPIAWYCLHPHNGVLQAMLDWGVPGALLFFAALGLAMLKTRQALRRRWDSGRLLGLWLLLMLLIFSLVSGTLYYALPLMVMGLALGLMGGDSGRPGAVSHPASGPRLPPVFAGAVGASVLVCFLNAASLMAVALPGLPQPDSARVRLLKAFPSGMALPGAGPSVDKWVSEWRRQGRTDGYDWLDWNMRQSASPWTSMALKASFLKEEGREPEGDEWQAKARARQHPRWQPGGG